MATGAPDWEKVVSITPSMTAGAPDWERVVVGSGGTPISGSGYKSLTGAGETATPGDLTQEGGLDVEAPAGSSVGFTVNNAAPAGIHITDDSTGGLYLLSKGANPLYLQAESPSYAVLIGPTVTIDGETYTSLTSVEILMPNLPTSDPHNAGQLWNNGGVLSVSA